MKLIISFIIMLPLVVFSQEETTFYFEYNDEPVKEVLVSLEKAFDVRFSYQNSYVEQQQITISRGAYSLKTILDSIALQTNLRFEIVDERYIIITKGKVAFSNVQLLDDIIINSYLARGISKSKDASYKIDPNTLEILPGLTEPDVLESIQQLPGVISPNETASGFSVRGGRSDQNRLIWDGINMYHKGHLFGMISPFNPNATQKITFINKGTHPKYGDRTSSVIAISSSNAISETVEAGIGVNAINGDAFLNLPLLQNKLSIQASIRRSYTELYQSHTFDQLADKVFQSTKITDSDFANNDFSFLDYNIKLNYKHNSNNSFHLSTIGIDNQLDYITKDNEANTTLNDVLSIKNSGYSMAWNKQWNSKFHQYTSAFFSEYRLDYNYITNENENQISDFDKRNVIFDSGISTEFELKTSNSNRLSFGYEYNLKDVSYSFEIKEELSFILDSDKRVADTHSVFGNYNYRNSKLFNVNIGLRSSYYNGLDAVRLEPRILVYKKLIQPLKLQVSGEIKNQIISEIDETVLSDLSLENKLWRIADGSTFPIIKSKQVSAGLIYTNRGWSFDIDHYYKSINNVTALSLGFLNPSDNRFHIGAQDIIGVDLFLKKQFKGFNSWISYAYNTVKNKYDTLNDNASFTASSNIRHAFSTSFTYKLNSFQIALGWKWQTGKPYTKYMDGVNGIEFVGINTERLPQYHRLDFSSTYSFDFSKNSKTHGKIGLSIRNVYNRKNHISREYTGNNTLNDPIEVVDKYSIGFTPNLLFRVHWN
ncbi:hypothetical protein A9Q87_07645 [Flavobacteriales bacterium 34_180_T64]|nr:hypothetical protein A9Q87_07645 [Flavobacteriales bacterium 34_180_T64]